MLSKIRSYIRFCIAFGIVLILTVIFMDKVVMPFYVSQGKSITMQDVRNISYSRAETKLNEMGLHAVVLDSVPNPDIPPFTVVEQQPIPGELVKKGRVIYLTISKGREYVEMPNLIGMAIKEAQLVLGQINLFIKNTEEMYSDDKPAGAICRQSITPGMSVAKQTSLALYISKGPRHKTYNIPDLIGLSLMSARKKIKEAGLITGNIDYIPNEAWTPMTVIKQNPKKNTVVDKIMAIDLEVTTTR